MAEKKIYPVHTISIVETFQTPGETPVILEEAIADALIAGGNFTETPPESYFDILGFAPINTGGVDSATKTDAGSGYTTATVSFSGGGGSGATADAVLDAGKIVSLTITDPGTGYTSAPTISISGDGTGAAFVAVMEAGTGDQPNALKVDGDAETLSGEDVRVLQAGNNSGVYSCTEATYDEGGDFTILTLTETLDFDVDPQGQVIKKVTL